MRWSGWISKASSRNAVRTPTRRKRSGRSSSMRSIRRRKGERTFFIVGGREREEVKGGGVPVILGDELPHVRGWERGVAVAARVGERQRVASAATGVTREGGGRAVAVRDARATRAGGSGAPVAASTAASSRSEHATGVTRGRAGEASALNVLLAR